MLDRLHDRIARHDPDLARAIETIHAHPNPREIITRAIDTLSAAAANVDPILGSLVAIGRAAIIDQLVIQATTVHVHADHATIRVVEGASDGVNMTRPRYDLDDTPTVHAPPVVITRRREDGDD